MKRVYRYKSILMVPEKPVDDGSAAYGGAVDTEKKAGKITYDPASAREHVLEAGPAHFLFCRSWIQSFLIALLAVIIVSAVAYGFMVVGLKVDFASPGGSLAGKMLICSMLLLFIAVLLAVGVPAAVKRLKLDLVLSERGPGAWKIVDSAKWGHFERLLRLAREREEEMARRERALKGGKLDE